MNQMIKWLQLFIISYIFSELVNSYVFNVKIVPSRKPNNLLLVKKLKHLVSYFQISIFTPVK
jgi:hypothetical protein